MFWNSLISVKILHLLRDDNVFLREVNMAPVVLQTPSALLKTQEKIKANSLLLER